MDGTLWWKFTIWLQCSLHTVSLALLCIYMLFQASFKPHQWLRESAWGKWLNIARTKPCSKLRMHYIKGTNMGKLYTMDCMCKPNARHVTWIYCALRCLHFKGLQLKSWTDCQDRIGLPARLADWHPTHSGNAQPCPWPQSRKGEKDIFSTRQHNAPSTHQNRNKFWR